MLLAVNGTLMRGLELNGNLVSAGASFVRETRTAPAYRLWSIGDRHPAMVRVREGGAAPVVGLTLTAEQREGVIRNLTTTFAVAQLVLEFPLPEDVDAGPVFEP